MARNFRYYEKKRGDRRTGSRLLGSVGEAIFFALMLVVGCAGVCFIIVWLIVPEWRVNHGFVQNECEVVKKWVDEVPNEKGLLFQPVFEINYKVEGATYAQKTYYDIHQSTRSTREEALGVIDRFTVGQTYPCWYDPAEPKVTVLARGYQWWSWPALLIPASFVAIGIGGLVYTALHWGKSLERRAAVVRSVPAAELFDLPAAADPKFPYTPDCSEITSSPGTRLAYRLPLTQSPGWTLLGLLVACVAWNGAVSVFVVMAVRSCFAGTPDWLMMLFIVPFLIVGVALVVVSARLVRHAAGMGPTLVEISDHPLLPGKGYRLFLSQSGNLTLKSIAVSLICEEEAVFRQGTNARTESREVFRQTLYSGTDAIIRPAAPLEAECDLPIPAQAMHSFRASHNQVQWKLIVGGEIAGGHGFQRSFPVVVRPLPTAAAGARRNP